MELSESSEVDKQQWEALNNITTTLDPESLNDISCQIPVEEKPWTDNPLYFNRVMISEVALLRMVLHISLYPTIPTLGILKGKIYGDAFVVLDARPILTTFDGSANPHDTQQKLLMDYSTRLQDGDVENVVGWFRSHPGHGHHIFSDDISTQTHFQQFKEPSLAVTVDPINTIPLDELSVRAFRNYPQSYTPPDELFSKSVFNLPEAVVQQRKLLLEKCRLLKITYFKSPSDSNLIEDLWNNYRAHIVSMTTLSQKNVRPADIEMEAETTVGPVQYFVHVSRKVTRKYGSADEVLEEVFAKLMEQVGSSKNNIGTYMSMFFFATLTEEQAEKMSGINNVLKVKQEFAWRIRQNSRYC